MKYSSIAILSFALLLSACSNGAQFATTMPTPILCKAVLKLSPSYLGYGEYIQELNNRDEDCGEYVS